MEQLQAMLIAYNKTIPEEARYSWSRQYLSAEFPRYWQVVFSELARLDRSLRILEIGAGQGDITAICCYLKFNSIKAYERNYNDFVIANDKIKILFGRQNVLVNCNYNNEEINCDVLILVNCVYTDNCHNKQDYVSIIKGYYETANRPRIFLLEVIDPSYSIPDEEFPTWVRISEEEIRSMFPKTEITSVETYKYPENKRSKKLYIIKHAS